MVHTSCHHPRLTFLRTTLGSVAIAYSYRPTRDLICFEGSVVYAMQMKSLQPG